MKPIIGITVDTHPEPDNARTRGTLKLNWNYAQVIADAGGIPVLIPPQANPNELVDLLDGLMIPGGDDIHPAEYGDDPHPKTETVPPERYQLEKSLFAAIQKRHPELPFLGVCYGCQFLNVQHGGSLEQHLPDRVGHENDIGGHMQAYDIRPESRLGEILGAQAAGESWHHQAVGRIGAELRVVAVNADGTPEALEADHFPFRLGVQWHPERTPDSDDSRRLFEAFIRAAAEFRRNRKA